MPAPFSVVVEGVCCCCFFFFFSSRRRHTRLVSDWSSDVCSSDLVPGDGVPASPAADRESRGRPLTTAGRAGTPSPGTECHPLRRARRRGRRSGEIGRASCRERVESAVGGGSVKKRKRGKRSRR